MLEDVVLGYILDNYDVQASVEDRGDLIRVVIYNGGDFEISVNQSIKNFFKE